MLIKTTITGTLWNWYHYQGYQFKSDQVLTASNSVTAFIEPGQGELGTSLTALDRVLPSTLFASGTLPEIVNGKYVTYIQPQYANWVNAGDVATWFETILPVLNLPSSENFMFALSLGGLATQYFSEQPAKLNFQGLALYDGFIQGTVPINALNFETHCKSALIVSNANDTTVLESANSQVLYDALSKVMHVDLVLLPSAAHDSWDHGFDPANKNTDSFFQFLAKQIAPPVVTPPVVVTPGPAVQDEIIITVNGNTNHYKLVKE